MSIQRSLLGLLADGQLHSGSQLAATLGVTRAAVWKNIRQLEELGIHVSASAGKGYQLSEPLELLAVDKLEANLDDAVRRELSSLELLWVTSSTSDYLLEHADGVPGQARACFAEYQSGGRGRRGRPWLVPAGHGLCLSLAWCFASSPANLACLGLVVGTAVLRAVRACGISKAELKWPNDVVVDGRKLAGVLIDVRGETTGRMHTVAGVGVNYQLDPATVAAVISGGGLQPVSLRDCAKQSCADRNTAGSLLLNEIFRAMREFETSGFEAFISEWRAADYLLGREVTVTDEQTELTGLAQGITEDGRLCVQSGEDLHYIVTGDVSVRASG